MDAIRNSLSSDGVTSTGVRPWWLLLVAVLLGSTGCTALTNPIDGVPAHRVPPQFFAEPKNNLVPIDISVLSLEPPRSYQLDTGDILGVYIDRVLPASGPDETPAPPQVNFPEADSELDPSLGYPIPVQEDGTLSLPLIKPISVRGFTLDQVRDLIRNAYIDAEILPSDQARPIVTLVKERTYNVIVVRQDRSQVQSSEFLRGDSDQSGDGSLVKLKAYQNDILHALVETGGLPGLNAKNEVKILRAKDASKRRRGDFLRNWAQAVACVQNDPCACPPKPPEDPSILKIPLRLPPGVIPSLRPQDITLQDGDIVLIENRETEVFYTGGLLPGGEHPLPRDYDLDVLGAMALAGFNIGGSGRAGGGGGAGIGGIGGGAGAVGGVPPGQLYILRKTDCNGQIAIAVDLNRAINNPRHRPLVQPGDVLILQYRCEEELINFGLGTFFTFGIRELFN